MNWTIHKGKRRPSWWWLALHLWYKKKTLRRQLVFDFSCMYDIGAVEQADRNKLFGIGYFPDHHLDSARFGWRYDPVKSRFVLSAYCYVRGQRIMSDLCEVFAGKTYQLSLCINKDYYQFIVMREDGSALASYSIPFWHNRKLSYALGPYFGGTKPAPHTMKLQLKKL